MLKTFLCIAVILSVAQGSSILEVLKRLLEEEERIQERGVYKVTKTDTSIRGTLMVDVNDCSKPEDGCKYTVKAKNSASPYDEKSYSLYTGPRPVSFEFTGLRSDGTYEVTGCIEGSNSARSGCGPKKATCDMKTRSTTCSYASAKKSLDQELETKGVMQLNVNGFDIFGRIQVDTRDCPKPFNCDYVVRCKPTDNSGPTTEKTYNVASTSSFTCKNLGAGTYEVSACKSGQSQCGPRIGKCQVPDGPCSMEARNSVY